MHLLLPPSETKATGGRSRPLSSRQDDSPLARARHTAVTALLALVSGDPAVAARDLLIPAGPARDALAANAAVRDSPCTPALRRYAGTVYDGLSFGTLDAVQQPVAGRSTIIFSGLFGIVRGDEPVPNYRVPAKAVLPGLGVAATFWRPVLAPVLGDVLRRGLIVDLRSGDYAAMWRPDRVQAHRVVPVRIVSPAPSGGYAVISYASKLAKGMLARELIVRRARGDRVTDVEDVVDAWYSCGGTGAGITATGALELTTANTTPALR